MASYYQYQLSINFMNSHYLSHPSISYPSSQNYLIRSYKEQNKTLTQNLYSLMDDNRRLRNQLLAKEYPSYTPSFNDRYVGYSRSLLNPQRKRFSYLPFDQRKQKPLIIRQPSPFRNDGIEKPFEQVNKNEPAKKSTYIEELKEEQFTPYHPELKNVQSQTFYQANTPVKKGNSPYLVPIQQRQKYYTPEKHFIKQQYTQNSSMKRQKSQKKKQYLNIMSKTFDHLTQTKKEINQKANQS